MKNEIDITKCSGVGCSVKGQCLRYTAKASARQSYFTDIPVVKNIDGRFLSCDYKIDV